MSWLDDLEAELSHGQAAVVVTLADVMGSSPREAGATMVVSLSGFHGSIGGGTLEHQAIQDAREQLKGQTQSLAQENIALGPSLGQCCGGSVTVVMQVFQPEQHAMIQRTREAVANGETLLCRTLDDQTEFLCVPTQDPKIPSGLRPGGACLTVEQKTQKLWYHMGEDLTPLMIFGAGHVGQALAIAFAPLPFRITWIDSRPNIFPSPLPGPNIMARTSLSPAEDIGPNTSHHWVLVLTHSHALDLEICRRALSYGPPPYLGLIGSETKRARFLSQLTMQGLSKSTLERLTCPIGLFGLSDKRPACIAASVAADLLIRREAAQKGIA